MPNYSAQIKRSARKWGVNPRILTALLRQESGLREGLTSSAGARDIAQFMPATARAYGVTLGDGRAGDDIDGAAHYLHDNLKRTHGDYRGALSIYNSGRPDAYKDPHFAGGQTYNYVRSIMGMAGNPGRSSSTNGSHGYLDPGSPPSARTVTDDNARTLAIIDYFHNERGKPGSLLNLSDALQATQTTQTTPGVAPSYHAGSQAPQKAYHGKLPSGVVNFEGKQVAAWIRPALVYARKHGWKGGVTSGFRSFADQTRIWNSGVRPAAKPGTSNHEGSQFPRGAVDVSDAQSLSNILRNSPYAHLLMWAGAKDPPHFSHPHNGSY